MQGRKSNNLIVLIGPFLLELRKMQLILLSHLLDVVQTLHFLKPKRQSESIYAFTCMSIISQDCCLTWMDLAGIG